MNKIPPIAEPVNATPLLVTNASPLDLKTTAVGKTVFTSLESAPLEKIEIPFSIQQPPSRDEKMHKNGKKAIQEGFANFLKNKAYINETREKSRDFLKLLPCLIPSTILPCVLPPLEAILSIKERAIEITASGSVQKGSRAYMEDQAFAMETDEGTLAAVFDGHGGSSIARISAVFFKDNFLAYLEQAGGNVGDAFTDLFQDAAKLAKEHAHLEQGSTAVLCYIDKATHAVYTATLGDSEARLYRKNPSFGKITSIPLSCVRDWSSEKDAIRAANYLERPSVATNWPLSTCSKDLRVSGLNVSRALGDDEIPPVSKKPKLSLNQVRPGDYLVIASDGVWDYLFENEVAEKLFEETDLKDKAKNITSLAIDSSIDSDNTTAIVIKIT